MDEPHHITLTVHYDRTVGLERSLGWIAPELKDSGLTLTEERRDGRAWYCTWDGVIDDSTLARFAEAWRLPGGIVEASPSTDADRRPPMYDYTLDGMNWETGGDSPIVCVSLRVSQE